MEEKRWGNRPSGWWYYRSGKGFEKQSLNNQLTPRCDKREDQKGWQESITVIEKNKERQRSVEKHHWKSNFE